MKSYRLLILVVVLAGFTLVPLAAAAPDATPIAPDRTNFATTNSAWTGIQNELVVAASGNLTAPGCLAPTAVTYMRFDLSSLVDGSTTPPKKGSIATAVLTVNSTGFDESQNAPFTMRLWGVNDDTWTSLPPTLAYATRPTLDVDLKTIMPGPVASDMPITFATSSELVSFLNAQLNEAVAPGYKAYATVAIAPEACTENKLSDQFMARNAVLTLTGLKPTAVEVSTASAQRTSWPLYAGLGVVALFVVAGVVITRRRTV